MPLLFKSPEYFCNTLALEVAFAQRLVAVLGPQTDTYFFGSAAEGNHRWDAQGFPADWLEQGPAVDVADLYQQERRWPTYMFAANRAWCLCQGQELQAEPTLETWPLR